MVFMEPVISFWRKYLKRYFFILLLLTPVLPNVFADEKKTQDSKSLSVLKSVENKYTQIRSLQSQLKKTTTLKVLQRETIYTGTLKFKNGGYLRIDMKSPVKSVLLINPKGTWHTQYPDTPEFDDKIRVIKTKTQVPLQTVLMSILEEGKILEHFNLLDVSSAKKSHTFKLNSKKGSSVISQLEVVVDRFFSITKITYWDSLQNKTVLDLHDILINKTLEDDIFEFKKPPNAEIIEN